MVSSRIRAPGKPCREIRFRILDAGVIPIPMTGVVPQENLQH